MGCGGKFEITLSQTALNLVPAWMARKPQNLECRESLTWAAWQPVESPLLSVNTTHRAPWGHWIAPDCLSGCSLSGKQMGEGFRECRLPQAATSMAALWLSWVFNIQRPWVLSVIFFSYQNHFRTVKRRCKQWPLWEEVLGEKYTTLPPRFTGCLYTINMYCFYFWGSYFKLFSLKEKKIPYGCVPVHIYTQCHFLVLILLDLKAAFNTLH